MLPIRGGDAVKLLMAHRAIKNATYTTLAASLLVLAIVDSVMGLAVFGYALTQNVLPSLDVIPDVVWDDARHFSSGDRGASEWTIRGTQANGEPIEVRGCDLFEFRDGKVSRKDSYWKIVS